MYNNNYYPYYNYQRNFNNFKKFNFNKILEGTQKTLGIINQAIPVIYQVKPLFNNIKTAFKVANIINRDDTNEKVMSNVNNNKMQTSSKEKKVEPSSSPTYFL